MTKLWGIGLSKTGLVSLMGYLKGYHKKNIRKYPNPRHYDMPEFDGFLDLPVVARWRELDERFPDSKWILTERNLDDWYRSISQWYMNRILDENNTDTLTKQWRQEVFGVVNPNPINTDFIELYHRHYSDVVNHFPEDKLLVINICDGDTPERLCEFLGLPWKGEKFPHLHKTTDDFDKTRDNL